MGCSPRRWAVLASVLQFLSCGAAAGSFFYLLRLASIKGVLVQVEDSNSLKAALISSGSSYTFCALLSFVGLLGAIKKELKLLRIEVYLIFFSILLQIATGLFITIIFNVLSYRNQTKEDCIQSSSDFARIDTCNALYKLRVKHTPKWATTWAAIFPMVIMIYACIVKLDYYHHLAQKMAGHELYENLDKHTLKCSDSVHSDIINPSMEKHSQSTQSSHV